MDLRKIRAGHPQGGRPLPRHQAHLRREHTQPVRGHPLARASPCLLPCSLPSASSQDLLSPPPRMFFVLPPHFPSLPLMHHSKAPSSGGPVEPSLWEQVWGPGAVGGVHGEDRGAGQVVRPQAARGWREAAQCRSGGPLLRQPPLFPLTPLTPLAPLAPLTPLTTLTSLQSSHSSHYSHSSHSFPPPGSGGIVCLGA